MEHPERLESFRAHFIAVSTRDGQFSHVYAVLDGWCPHLGELLSFPVVTALVVDDGLVWVVIWGDVVFPCAPVHEVPAPVRMEGF